MLIQPPRDAGRASAPETLHPSLFPAEAPPHPDCRIAVLPLARPRAETSQAGPAHTTGPPVRRGRRLLPLLGPAFVAAIAYVDPGNFATNISAGATYGYLLVWVVVLANIVAVLVQYLSAKLGVATGQDLAQLCGERLPVAGRFAMWAQAELVVMATDLAEFVGAAIALQLLFGLGPLTSGLITAVIACAILSLRRRGRRPFELTIIVLFAAITIMFIYVLVRSGVSPSGVAGGLEPRFGGAESLLLATGIVGATVMPHAVYVHSSMTAGMVTSRTAPVRRQQILRAQRVDILIALSIAGAVNVSMLIVAAALFTGSSLDVSSLQDAHTGLAIAAGAGAALAFGIALLASGLSSASVGTFAGEVVMRGYIRRRISPLRRRLITMLPALVLLASGADTGHALILSQVVLSFGIPFTLLPLVVLTARRSVMGHLVNRALTTAAAATVAAAITGLNGFLIVRVMSG